MSQIFMRPEANNNWYYIGADGRKRSMRKNGVSPGPGGKLQAQMLQNQWDNEAFYSRNGIVNPEKRWADAKADYMELYSFPAHAKESCVKLDIVLSRFEDIVKPDFMLPICGDDIVRWRKARLADGLIPRSVDAEEKYLAPMLEWAHRKNYIKEDPFVGLKRLEFDVPEPRHLSLTESNSFLAALHKKYPEHMLLGLMAYESGMRVGELVHLRIEDIDFMRSTARLLRHDNFCSCFQCKKQKVPGWKGKKGVPRNIPLSSRVNAELLRLFQERKTGNIFEKARNTVIGIFKRTFFSAGIKGKAATHIFRHTFATHCDQAGVRSAITSRILGHSTGARRTDIVPTTAGYTHIDGDTELHEGFQKLLDWRSGSAGQQVIAIH